jgi:hypothetical protein
MLERAARAMCRDLGVNPDDWDECDGVRVHRWELELSTARVAIDAAFPPELLALAEAADSYAAAQEHFESYPTFDNSSVAVNTINALLAHAKTYARSRSSEGSVTAHGTARHPQPSTSSPRAASAASGREE